MRLLAKICVLLTAAVLCYGEADACTAAVVAPKASKEGGTILWKNRDSKHYDTCVRYLTSEKYAYTGVVQCAKPASGVLCGVNEVGFGIINTASGNLPKSRHLDPKLTGARAPFMRDALIHCATVDEFEEFVRNYVRGPKFTTNVGVGDAKGGAAIFEIWGDGYRRYDVDKMERGYDIRTNFSFAGNMKSIGRQKRRCDALLEQMERQEQFSAADFYGYSCSFHIVGRSDALGDRLAICDNLAESVPRRTTVGSFTIVCGENPRILVSMGYPAACPAIPVWVEAKEQIPKCLSGNASNMLGHKFAKAAYIADKHRRYMVNKPLIRKALAVKTKFAFPKSMPKDIDKFNRKADERFEQHHRKIEQLIAKSNSELTRQ